MCTFNMDPDRFEFTTFPDLLAAESDLGVRSVAIWKRECGESPMQSTSAERWNVTDLLEQRSYVVTQRETGYEVRVHSPIGCIVANIEPDADVTEVVDRLARLTTPSQQGA